MASKPANVDRRLPTGAEPTEAGVSFRVWAPKRQRVEIVLDGNTSAAVEVSAEADGYFSGIVSKARAGTRYQFRLDGGDLLLPDPVSRYQPEGVHGPSEVVDPKAFQWTDTDWKGVPASGQVLYEMHIGTFTKEGTYAAAEKMLPTLKELGVTCLEIMPLVEFAGKWGWGYDGVDLFAPYHHYGTPDELKHFINACHAIGIGAILDVVYNHFGPDGNYLSQFSDTYFSITHHTDWGDAINFDSEGNAGVREYFVANTRYWIEEYHFDGYRFDATQAIVDDSKRHILVDITEAARSAGGERSIYLINENEPQHTKLVRPINSGGYGMDALWNDDFHHTAMVALTGRSEAYYTDYLGKPQEFISAAKYGYLFQGQRYFWQKHRRGTPALDLPATAFVHFLQNHDQIANSGKGDRVHVMSGPALFRTMTALLLLTPQTPMLFQGQEWAASSTFHYFANHNAELSKLIEKGRAKELAQFPGLATPEMQEVLVNPSSEDAFTRSKLNHEEREREPHKHVFRLHKELLKLRREDKTLKHMHERGSFDAAVLSSGALVFRFFGEAPGGIGDRLLLINFGHDLNLQIAPEPLLAPPLNHRWAVLLSTEEPRFGGTGATSPETELEGWLLSGRCASVMRALPMAEFTMETRVRVRGSAQAAKRRPPRDANAKA